MRVEPDQPSLTSRGLPRAGDLDVAGRALARAFADLTAVVAELGRIMERQRVRWLLAAYRAGLLPWPTPRHCYQHRRRWAGRRPRRRRR